MCAVYKSSRRRQQSSNLRRYALDIGSAVSELIYPAVCVVCERRHASGTYSVCPPCWRKALKQRIRLPEPEPSTFQPETGLKSIPAISLGKYQPPLDEMLQKFKYESFISLGERLALATARLRTSEILALKAEALVPIPLHISGFKARGFNQAEVISDILSEVTGLPVLSNVVEKIVKTKNQAKLTIERRQSNLAGAFDSGPWSSTERRVLLVDDVITTGSTVAEVGKTLEQAGATVVGAFAMASAVSRCEIACDKERPEQQHETG